jgi:hypothetical protein
MENTIIVNTPKSKNEGVTVKVRTDEKISSAKEKYYNIVENRINNQWICNATVLRDGKTIDEEEIEDKDIIEAHPSSKGG